MIGGTLAEPVKRFPTIFRPGTLWERYPFLLPNVIVAALLNIVWLVTFLLLRETHWEFSHRADHGIQMSEFIGASFRRCFTRKRFIKVQQSEDLVQCHRQRMDEGETSVELERLSSPDQVEAGQEYSIPHKSPYTIQITLQVLSVSMLAFHKVSSDILIPMFLSTPAVVSKGSSTLHRELLEFMGGFGMSTAQIGNVLLTQAVAAVMFQKFAIPQIIARCGALQSYRTALHLFPCLYLLTPFAARLASPLGIFALLLDLWTKTFLVGLGYNSSAIL